MPIPRRPHAVLTHAPKLLQRCNAAAMQLHTLAHCSHAAPTPPYVAPTAFYTTPAPQQRHGNALTLNHKP